MEQLPGGQLLRENFMGGISWWATVWRVLILGELFEANCPADKSPEDNYP